MKNNKYVKVMFGTTSGAKSDFEYKIDEVNVANNWNPNADNPSDFGGFNYATEDCIIRWLHRGNIVYEVEIPDDAEVVRLEGATVVYRANKIILHNPQPIDDDLALHYYKISNIPEKSYYKALGAVSLMNYRNTALAIMKDRVHKEDIDTVLEEWNNFISHGGEDRRKPGNELIEEVDAWLHEIKSDLLVSRFVDKKPYIKELTRDKVINLTGESGSGKSYFSNRYINDDNYIVIDTDVVFSDRPSDNTECLALRKVFSNQPNDYLFTNFDEFYLKVLDYYKDTDKTIVIDSAQYRNIKDYAILKGQVIVMRPSVNTCYERTLNRYKDIMKENYDEEKFQKYANKKKGMFDWYKSINKFLINIDKL